MCESRKKNGDVIARTARRRRRRGSVVGRGSLLDFRVMASRRCALLAAILITICLDVSSIVATAAAVALNPKISRYNIGSYNLDKGPVFYEAYYPDPRDAYREKRYFGRNTVLETSFQVPLERFAYSAETAADHPISINESFVVVDNEETLPRDQRKARMSQRNYDAITTSQLLAPVPNERSIIFDDTKKSQVVNIEEISKLVRRAISRDLENWNVLEGYLDRTTPQDRPQPQPQPQPQSQPQPPLGMHFREIHKNREGFSYMFPVNRGPKDSLERSSILEASSPRKLDAQDGKQGPIYFEGVDANGNTMTSEMRMSETQAVETKSPPIDVISDLSPAPEDILQPRPQLIKYIFFKRPGLPRQPRLDKQDKKAIDESTSRNSGNNLIRKEIADNNHGGRVEENVKVTSIEISELPRHKTRHHHGEWPNRDFSIHRSRPAYPTVS